MLLLKETEGSKPAFCEAWEDEWAVLFLKSNGTTSSFLLINYLYPASQTTLTWVESINHLMWIDEIKANNDNTYSDF